jgi:hypothetical protein
LLVTGKLREKDVPAFSKNDLVLLIELQNIRQDVYLSKKIEYVSFPFSQCECRVNVYLALRTPSQPPKRTQINPRSPTQRSRSRVGTCVFCTMLCFVPSHITDQQAICYLCKFDKFMDTCCPTCWILVTLLIAFIVASKGSCLF